MPRGLAPPAFQTLQIVLCRQPFFLHFTLKPKYTRYSIDFFNLSKRKWHHVNLSLCSIGVACCFFPSFVSLLLLNTT